MEKPSYRVLHVDEQNIIIEITATGKWIQPLNVQPVDEKGNPLTNDAGDPLGGIPVHDKKEMETALAEYVRDYQAGLLAATTAPEPKVPDHITIGESVKV